MRQVWQRFLLRFWTTGSLFPRFWLARKVWALRTLKDPAVISGSRHVVALQNLENRCVTQTEPWKHYKNGLFLPFLAIKAEMLRNNNIVFGTNYSSLHFFISQVTWGGVGSTVYDGQVSIAGLQDKGRNGFTFPVCIRKIPIWLSGLSILEAP